MNHRIHFKTLQLQVWYRLAELEELALWAMMGLVKEARMVICLSDVNTILFFHALLRLLGDRGLKIPQAPLSAQFLWLGSVSGKHDGRLDRSGKRRSHFSSDVWCGSSSNSDSRGGNMQAPSPSKYFQQWERKGVFCHPHPRRQPLWGLGLLRASLSSKLPPEQRCWFQGCPQMLRQPWGDTVSTHVLSPLILQPGG